MDIMTLAASSRAKPRNYNPNASGIVTVLGARASRRPRENTILALQLCIAALPVVSSTKRPRAILGHPRMILARSSHTHPKGGRHADHKDQGPLSEGLEGAGARHQGRGRLALRMVPGGTPASRIPSPALAS